MQTETATLIFLFFYFIYLVLIQQPLNLIIYATMHAMSLISHLSTGQKQQTAAMQQL